MFYVCARDSNDKFKILDTDDGVVDLCTLDEIKGFISKGLSINGVSRVGTELSVSVLYPLTFKEENVTHLSVSSVTKKITDKQSRVIKYLLKQIGMSESDYLKSYFNECLPLSDICVLLKLIDGKGDLLTISPNGVQGLVRGIRPRLAIMFLEEDSSHINWLNKYNADSIVLVSKSPVTISGDSLNMIKCSNLKALCPLVLDIDVCCKFIKVRNDLTFKCSCLSLRHYKGLVLSVDRTVSIENHWLFMLRSLNATKVLMSEGSSFISMLSFKVRTIDKLVRGMFFKSPELHIFKADEITDYIGNDSFCHVRQLDLSGFTNYESLSEIPNLSGFKLCSHIKLSNSIVKLNKGVFSNVTNVSSISIPHYLLKAVKNSGLPEGVKIYTRGF